MWTTIASHCPPRRSIRRNSTATIPISSLSLGAGVEESRPSEHLGPINVVNGRVHLDNLPEIPTGPGIPAYDKIRIYRNLSSDAGQFYLVDEIDPGQDYTDSKTDAQISDLSIITNKKVDLDGPKLASNTLLTNVLRRDGLDYVQVYEEGTLSFQGRKGGRALIAKNSPSRPIPRCRT